MLPPPRTAFEADAFRRNLKRIRDPKTNVIIGFFAVESGVYKVYNIHGQATVVGEKPLESPAVDPIDLIPFELVGSLAKDAAVGAGKAVLKVAGKTAVKEAEVEAAEIGTRALVEGAGEGGMKAAAGQTGKAGAELSIDTEAAQKLTPKSSGPAGAGAESSPARVNAPPLGESQIKPSLRSGLNVDAAVQEHNVKSAFREGTGKAVQSAHMIPSSATEDIVNYSRGKALTVLMPRESHAAFDAGWMSWARAQVAAGRTQVTVEEFLQVLDTAAEAVPNLRGRTSDTMSWLFHIEAYKTLGLKPTDLLRIPFS
jgi:hypothetical protein